MISRMRRPCSMVSPPHGRRRLCPCGRPGARTIRIGLQPELRICARECERPRGCGCLPFLAEANFCRRSDTMRTTLALALMGAVLISVPATAQTAGSADTTRANTNNAAANAAAGPLFEMKAGQWRATKLDGLSVYDPRNEKIGDINEMIVGGDGRIAAVVVGVGGFLGIGEHNAAIPFDQVQWVDEPVNRTVSGNTTATTSGSGTSAPAPAASDRADRASDTMNTPAATATTAPTETRVDPR